jgi:hypothetical protein
MKGEMAVENRRLQTSSSLSRDVKGKLLNNIALYRPTTERTKSSSELTSLSKEKRRK